MDDEKQLGINIRELRKLRLLTQDELAERAGFSLQHVGDIERGKANPTLSCLLVLPGFPWVADLLMSFGEDTNEGHGPVFPDSWADRALVC